MSAPDFYFAINEIFRHLHDRHGRSVLEDYWRALGREHYRQRNARWAAGGPAAIAKDWREYFALEPGAEVQIEEDDQRVTLEIRVCPAIAHLRQNGREIVPYFCDHCDGVAGAQAEAAGFHFTREGGGGACRQQFVRLRVQEPH